MADPFQPRFVDLVRNYTTTAGTGDFVLGAAVNGYASFASACQVGDRFYYSAIGVDKPAEREVGRGTLLAGGIIGRDPIGGTKTNFSSGKKSIALIAAAEWFNGVQAASSSAGAAAAGTRVALASSSTQGPAFLTEARREGLFVWDNSDLSARVLADQASGLYVAPASDPTGASGAWVRKFDGPVLAPWFGLAAANSGTANSDAIEAAQAVLKARAVNVSTNYQGLETLRFPAGAFSIARTIEITDGTMTLEGDDTGFASARGTQLVFPAGVTGIRVQRYNTSGAGGAAGATHRAGDGAIIRNLALQGGYTTTEAEVHGIHLRARAHVENVDVVDFEGDGISIVATSGGNPEGNANCARVIASTVQNCRNGLYIDGADANAGTFIGCSFISNRQWGVFDSSFLGNTHLGHHTSDNGIQAENDGVSIGASVVSQSGNRYAVIAGQEAGASTNAPSGTTADNTWWYYVSAGAPGTGIPAWVSGILCRAGGSYRSDSGNSRSVFSSCYSEGGQGSPQIASPALAVGGFAANGAAGATAAIYGNSTYATTTTGFQQLYQTKSVKLGEKDTTTLFSFQDSAIVGGTGIYRWKASGNDFRWDYNNTGSTVPFWITGAATAMQFGTGAAFPHVFFATRLAISDYAGNTGNARRIQMESAVPAANAHGQGEIAFNRTPTLAGPVGWVCTTAGTPGTWAADYLNARADSTTGIGYVTGAGGAVTQATSRTTGVTLNKVCGAITLVSAAGSASWQTFTVTNSTVAATDTIRVVQQSGTDLYMIHVTNVAAGSFKVSFATTGGTTTEQPVFNFAVVKAVAA